MDVNVADLVCPVLRRLIELLEEQQSANARVRFGDLISELRYLEAIAGPLAASAATSDLLRATGDALQFIEATRGKVPANQDAPESRPMPCTNVVAAVWRE